MGENRILLHNLKKNLVKHIIILVISVITLVTAIVSLSFEEITRDIRIKQLADMTMNEEIIISVGEGEDPEKIASLIESADNVSLTVPKTVTQVFSDISSDAFTLYGVDYGVQNSLSEIPVVSGEIGTEENSGLMISRELAETYELSVGDQVMITAGESQETLEISAVCDEKCSLFDNFSTCLLTDRMVAEKLSGSGADRIDVSLEDPELIDDTVSALNEVLDGHDVEISQKYDSSFFDSFVFTIVLALRIFVVFAIIMAVYLIFSLYRTLIYEQSSEMAVLRSIGMSMKGYIAFVLKQTLITYLTACIFSYFLSRMLIKAMLGIFVGYSGDSTLSLSPVLLLIIYGGALIVCILSVIAGIYRQASMSVISILRSGVCEEKKKRYKGPAGALCLAAAVILYFTSSGVLVGLLTALVLTLISMILLSEIAVGILTALTEHLGLSRYTIGLKQLSSSRSSYTLIFDLAAFVIVLLIVARSVSSDLDSSISKIYGDQSIYTEVYSELTDDDLESIAEDISAEDHLRLRKASAELSGQTYTIEAVPVEDYSKRDYEYVYGEKVSHQELFERLLEKNSVIISSTAAKNLDLEKGDRFMCCGTELTVEGIAATYDNMGRVIYTSYETLEGMDYGQSFDVVLFRCASPSSCVEKIRERADELSVDIFVETTEELFQNNNERNQMMIRIIVALSCFMGLVALICLYNTVKLCLQRRMGNYVILRTVGADKALLTATELIGSAVNAAVNMLYALPFAFFLNRIVRGIVSFYYGEGSTRFCSPMYILAIAAVITAAYVVCKLVLLKRELFRADIVENIKKRAL